MVVPHITSHTTIEWPFINEPREVQMRALNKGYGREGFAYFLRQRLGKTWIAYAEYTLLKEESKVDWMIIICPNSIKQQWIDAILEVDLMTPVHSYQSGQKQKTERFFELNKGGGVFIINYESVKSFMVDRGWQKFDPLRTYIVADESSKIKEPRTKMCKACLELASICYYKRILTGKPKSNNNSDMWAQLKFINATERNFHQHKFTFCLYGGFEGRQVVKDINTDMLRNEMTPHCYIAEDKYIQGFEKVYEPMRYIELPDKLQVIYKEMENDLIVEISSGASMTAPIILTKYLRLQQISSGIGGDVEGIQHNLVEPKNNPRIQEVIDLLENEIDHKVIIVCRFTLSIINLQEELTKRGYKVAVMRGNMGKELDIEKKKFTEGDYDILLAQIQVLNFGHTLCGPDDNPCSDMIFYEKDFSLINRSQCESRNEKMERKKPISYWDFYASEMDKIITDAIIRKEDGAMALMGYARSRGIFPKG